MKKYHKNGGNTLHTAVTRDIKMKKEKGMKSNKIARICLSILLTAAMLLPSCGGNTPEPTEKPSDAVSQIGSETPSDTTSEEKPFRSLTAEEAEVLFGNVSPFDASRIENGYFYFFDTPADPKSNGNGEIPYRYNSDTGEIEYVCRKPGCAHIGDPETLESDCPLYSPGGCNMLSVLNGKVVFQGGVYKSPTFGEEEKTVVEESGFYIAWYDPQTNESRAFKTLETNDINDILRGKNDFYYSISAYDRATKVSRAELWKVDEAGGDPVLVATYEGVDKYIIPYLVNGEEVFLGFSTEEVPSGETPSDREWIYRIDEKTGERSLFYEKSVPSYIVDICGNMLLYNDYDTDWFLTHDPKDDTPIPDTLRLVDLSTGEEKTLVENVTDLRNYLLTDRCVMYILDDPTGENAFILHCYNYLTGEKTEYPLKGRRWSSYKIFYDQGQLYLLRPSLLDEEGRPVNYDDLLTVVVWDIATGAQREIYKNEIVKEIR